MLSEKTTKVSTETDKPSDRSVTSLPENTAKALKHAKIDISPVKMVPEKASALITKNKLSATGQGFWETARKYIFCL